MLSPFYYPKVRHARTQTPPSFGSYRPFKPFLQTEFGRRCVYCRASDAVKGADNFGVDHYRPQKKFAHLATEYSNLFYACNRCNRLKRDYWPSVEEKRREEWIPNPCDHVMFEHLRYKGGFVDAVSKTGEWTRERLDLNDDEGVKMRSTFITLLNAVDSALVSAKLTLQAAAKKASAATTPAATMAAQQAVIDAQKNVDDLEAALKFHLG